MECLRTRVRFPPPPPMQRATRKGGPFLVRLPTEGWLQLRADGPCAGFGSSGAPTGGCSPARQASMPDSPPQAIHGLLSASPGQDAASAIGCRGFFIGNRRSRAVGDVTPTYSALPTGRDAVYERT